MATEYFTMTQRKWITCLITVGLGFAGLLAGEMEGNEFVQLASTVVGGFFVLNVAEKNVHVNIGQK